MKVIRPLITTMTACDLTGHAVDLDHHYRNVQRVPDALEGQHPIRLWEYAMTLRSLYAWMALHPYKEHSRGLHIADVGGASSKFWKVLKGTGGRVTCIDPAYTPSEVEGAREEGRHVIASSIAEAIPIDRGLRGFFDVVTCVSVLEHIKPDSLSGFLTDLTLLLRPGGCLLLTCDYAPPPDPILVAPPPLDTYHFHWMREQIFTSDSFRAQVIDRLDRLGYNLLGNGNLAWLGPQVYDYSMLAAAFVWQPDSVTIQTSPETPYL